jgi:acyl-CoA synthetase (AMP-forming)/AMP-acid ligase II
MSDDRGLVPLPGMEVQIINEAGRVLEAHKCPVDYRFVEALPRNATGKLVRRRLGD